MNAPATLVTAPATDNGNSLIHLYCCDPNTAHCGADISDEPEVAANDDSPTCVVCVDLDHMPCSRGCDALGGTR